VGVVGSERHPEAPEIVEGPPGCPKAADLRADAPLRHLR